MHILSHVIPQNFYELDIVMAPMTKAQRGLIAYLCKVAMSGYGVDQKWHPYKEGSQGGRNSDYTCISHFLNIPCIAWGFRSTHEQLKTIPSLT